MIDTTGTIEIRQSRWKTLLLIVLALGFVALGGAMVSGSMDGRRPDVVVQTVGWISIVFFGACGLIGAWRLVSVRGPVVTISSAGIRDVRVSGQVIPWGVIADISTWSHKGQKVMVLAIDPEFESGLSLSGIARITRRANAMLGADGLCVVATGLRTGYDDLLATTVAYARRYRDNVS